MHIALPRAALPLAVLAVAAIPRPAGAQDWFQHPFGELRGYHLDWLAVCAEKGDGPCRVVYSAADIGSGAAFDRRLTVRYDDAAGTWTPEVMDRGMPERELSRITFAFGEGEPIDVPPLAVTPGEAGGEDVAETVTVSDPALADILVAEMRAGRRLLVTYEPAGTGDAEADFSLMGVRDAMDAVEAHVAKRKGADG